MSRIKKFLFIPILCCIVALSQIFTIMGKENIQTNNDKYTLPDNSQVEIYTNRHTQMETGNKVSNSLKDLSSFEKKLENDTLEVWFKEDIASIRVVDKRSGYVWGSLKGDTDEDLNEDWSNMANSICTVDYYDKDGTEKSESLSSQNVKTEYKWNNEKLDCNFKIENTNLSVAFSMTIDNNKLKFKVKNGSVSEDKNALIKSLYFIPFLGCVKEDEIDGYIFIPDGSGALIRFAKSASYTSPFQKKIYGMDYGIDTVSDNNDILSERPNDFCVESPIVSCPVFGAVHGAKQNAFFAEISSGEDYSVISAYPAGFVTDYNWVTSRFDYRQKYVKPTGNNSSGIETPQEKANNMIPEISFTFLTGNDADYSGMAREYRKNLLDKKLLSKERIDKNIPMQITLVGADLKKDFPSMKLSTFTKIDEAEKILSNIKEYTTKNLSVVYTGWKSGGLSGFSLNNSKFEKKLGSHKEFENIRDIIQKDSGRFFLDINPIVVTDKQIKPSNNAAVTFGKDFETIVRDNKKALFNKKYIMRPTDSADFIMNLSNKGFALCLSDLGTKLYSDSSLNNNLSRTQTKHIFEKLSSSVKSRCAYFKPNNYMWKNTLEYYDIPMVNSQYVYETDAVPFLQMVLKGSIDYYAPYANIGFYNKNNILKMIEYGSYPSFILMASDNYSLHNTELEDYFSLQYSSWKEKINDIYSEISKALKYTEGESMTEHTVISNGVIMTSYSNKIKIIVNYTSNDVNTEYGKVSAKSYFVKEG